MTEHADDPLERITLRPQGDGDTGFLRRLYAGTRADELSRLPWTEEEKQSFLTMQFEAQTRHYSSYYADAELLVIEDAAGPIGRLYLQRRDDEIRVVDIALLPEHRGRGIGSALMQRVLEEARRTGIACRIHVEAANPALHLYRRLGFRQVDESGVYLLMEWRQDRSVR
jgi:ribosomal protein S18 acetylase RimI-like enzyme